MLAIQVWRSGDGLVACATSDAKGTCRNTRQPNVDQCNSSKGFTKRSRGCVWRTVLLQEPITSFGGAARQCLPLSISFPPSSVAPGAIDPTSPSRTRQSMNRKLSTSYGPVRCEDEGNLSKSAHAAACPGCFIRPLRSGLHLFGLWHGCVRGSCPD